MRQQVRDGLTTLFGRMTPAERDGLRAGLASNDPALVRGKSLVPGPLDATDDQSCSAGCLVGYSAWKGGCGTLGEASGRFSELIAGAGADRVTRLDWNVAQVLNAWDSGELQPREILEVMEGFER